MGFSGVPVFECSRCNTMTYSASRFASITCDACGGTRLRVLEHAFTFEDARAQPRELCHGDHCCLLYDDPAEVAPLAAEAIRRGVNEGARVVAYPPPGLRELVLDAMTIDEAAAVEWWASEDMYGDGFEPDLVLAEFQEVAEVEERPLYIVGGPGQPLSAIVSAGEFRRFEQLATDAAGETGIVLVCLYDRTLHHDAYLRVGVECHPLVAAGGALRRNEDFVFAG